MSQRVHTLSLGTVVVNQKNESVVAFASRDRKPAAVYWAYNGHLRAALKESN